MLESANKTIDIREYWRIFWRKKFFFVIPFVLSTIIGLIISFIMKPVYESSTVVQVSQGQLLSGALQRLVPGVTMQERLENLRTLITSHDYLKRLIDNLNLTNHPEMMEKANREIGKYPGLTNEEVCELLWIDLLKKFLVIRQLGRGDFIQLSAYSSNADMAFNLAKTLTQIFIDESLRREVGGIRGALEFSSEQLDIYKKKLEESEARLQKFKEDMLKGNINIRSTILANTDQIIASLTAIEFEFREAKDRLFFLNEQLKNLNKNYRSPNSILLSRLKAQLFESVNELSKLMLDYSWLDINNPRINSDTRNLREKINREIETIISSQYGGGNGDANIDLFIKREVAAIDVEFLQRKKEALTKLINSFKTSISDGPSREMTLSRLEREVAANRELYQTLLQQTRGSEIEEALQKTAAEFKFSIIEPAIKPAKPIRPNRLRLFLMAAFLGAALGVGLIFLLEYINHSFKNVEEVEKYLNLPVLGIAPRIEINLYKNVE